MPDPAKITEEEAYKQFTAALRRGQEGLDELDPEVKKLAMGPAEASLGAPSWSDPTDPSSEGFDIVEEVAPTVVKDDPSAEGYEPIEAVAPPDPDAGKEYESREDYKGFKAPKGMSDEQSEAWKAGVDDRLLESDERLQERIESAHPADQAQDLLRRASEGDMEAIKDIGYLGLNIAAMSPIGQIPQMGADAGVGVMDLAEGDYTGAAISGAAVFLPITAGTVKQIVKGVRKPGTLAADVASDPLEKQLLAQLDDTPNISTRANMKEYEQDWRIPTAEYQKSFDFSKLSDEQVEALSERNRILHSGKPDSGFDERIPAYSDAVPPEVRKSLSKEEWELVKDEVRDSRYRLAGLKDAISDEAKKRRGEGNFKPTIVNKDPVRSPDYNPNKLGDDEWGY